jgi:hypothetical protein
VVKAAAKRIENMAVVMKEKRKRKRWGVGPQLSRTYPPECSIFGST